MTAPQQADADTSAQLQGLIRDSPFPLFLVRLSDAMLLECSRAMETWAVRDREQLVGRRMIDFVTDKESAWASLQLLQAGVLDAYTRRATYLRPDDERVDFEIRITAYVEQSPRETAVALILTGGAEMADEAASRPSSERIVIGTVDSTWTIDRITTEVADLLGYDACALIGTSAFELVHPADVSSLLLLAGHAADRPPGTCGRIRVRTRDGGWLRCRVTVQPLAGEGALSFAFTLSGPPAEGSTDGARVRELEEHLRRIAREVAASGVAAWSKTLPTAAALPELSALTSREYEIVVRLFGGDRVPAIARALFLSESTVRNHLTAVYRKFRVRSQNELLARLHAVG